MHFICIYLLALLHIFEYTKKDELYPAIGKEELFQMLYSKNKKRGFTLVELIVVLVILAILAALLIPALTGYIDKAKKDQVIAETRMLHEAVQTEMSEIYGSSAQWRNTKKGCTTIASSSKKAMPLSDTYVDSDTLGKRYEEIVKLSEVPSLQNNTGKFVAFVNGQGKVHALIYYTGRKYYGVYFSDTQQYTAYEDGEATDAGNFSSTAYNDYYSTVFYHSAIDLSTDNERDDLSAYFWSCPGIRVNLGIDRFVAPW